MNPRLLLAAGAAGPLFFLAAVLVGGWINPGYSHLAGAVSELTEAGAPRALPVQVLFSCSAVAMVCVGVGMRLLHGSARQLRWAGWLLVAYALIALLLATIFPMDPIGAPATLPGILHLVLVGVSAVMLVAAILLAGRALERTFGWRWYWAYSLLSVGLMAAGGLATPFLVAGSVPLLGLAERITQFAYLQWLFIYAVRSATGPVPSSQRYG